MGLFSSRNVTYVSSTVYNLAGDEDLRPDFLKTVIVGNALSGDNRSVGETLVAAQMRGTGMQQRRYFQWAKANYALGLPTATLTHTQQVDTAAVKSTITSTLSLGSNDYLDVVTAVIDAPDAFYWAESWVRINRPSVSSDGWSHDYDRTTDEIVISFPGEEIRLAAPADLLWGMEGVAGRKLLYATYSVTTAEPDTGFTARSTPQLFVYRMGTGNVGLDALDSASGSMEEFFPALPLRINNVSISDAQYETEYAAVKKAYNKLTGSKVTSLLESIEENEKIGDIDFVYLTQGIPLNVKEHTCKAYLYRFFQQLEQTQQYDAQAFADYQTAVQAEYLFQYEWERWHNSTGDEYRIENTENAPVPPTTVSTPPGENSLELVAPDVPNFDIRIKWNFIKETQHTGNAARFDGDQARPRLKHGEYRFHVMEDYQLLKRIVETERGYESTYYIYAPYSRIFLFHQHAKRRYSRLEIVGLVHQNYVYNSVPVTTPANLAIQDEEESGFLVPLHYPTLRKMSLLDATQMTTANTFLVFNSYEVVKIRWYQRSIFKIILVIVAVVITVVFPPAGGLAAGAGILGTNVAVGTFLGATAAQAAIVGAVVNSIAAILVSKLITKFSVKLFGEKLGAVIGTIVSFVAITYGTQFMTHGNFSVDWGSMMRAENILKLTDGVANAYSAWINADTNEIYAELNSLEEAYGEKLEEIQEMSDKVLGMTEGIIDPMMFTEIEDQFVESSDAFLGRTLLTGSDIAELTHSMIEGFADISLSLPDAIG